MVRRRDLVFGVRSGCASGSADTKSQVSVYSGYDLCHPGCPRMLFVHLTPFDPEKLLTQVVVAPLSDASTMQIW